VKTRASSKSEENQGISQGRRDGEENVEDRQNNEGIIEAHTFTLKQTRPSFSVVAVHFLSLSYCRQLRSRMIRLFI